ncbi:zinc transporter ZIP3 [Aplysia californica]|uniref:Zinc transporter ZIP3 n=1 Tax=Aplysia californica TaxID=6500 RepID=A0ABM0JUI5_APLCA|nr:zinc transporter ZIP3 [Aplysia californica]
MDDNSIKGICLSLFFLDTMFFGCLPYLLVGKSGSAVSPRSARIRTTITSYLNCFAGGVFLGACLLHLMVEGRETLDEYFALANKDVDFPVYECVAAAGFFLIALIEQLAHKCLEHADTDLHQDVSIIENQGGIQLSQLSATNGGHVNTLSYISTESDNIILNNNGAENGSAADRQGVRDGTQVNPLKTESDANSTSRGPQAVHVPTSFNDDLEKKNMFKMMEVRPMRAFLLLGAFSFHTVFDGLAVGLQQDSSNIWQAMSGVIAPDPTRPDPIPPATGTPV